MLITLENTQLKLTVDTFGAQMMSLVKDGTEYLWQGDPTYWGERAPNLFPIIGRLCNGTYRYGGKTYQLGLHGFAKHGEFAVIEQGAEHMVLGISDSPATMESYPFRFRFEIAYRLTGDTVETTYRVRNQSEVTMPFAVGGHPGFHIPFASGEKFEDYYLEFSEACQPDQILFGPAALVSGQMPYKLENGQRIRLSHALFDEEAIVLQHVCREVTLRSQKSNQFVRVSYPQMSYLGLWHMPKTDAPYVCIEPWTSLPGREDTMEDFSCKSDFIYLEPGKTYENQWTITIGE